MPDIMANGIHIHYERTGGDKPPLVLCHGITDTGRCWPRVEAALKQDYDLIMLDAHGHGLSGAPATGYSVDILAADVAGVIQALGLGKAGIIGHSMGAMTAAVTAAHYPDLVTCLVLEDPPWKYPLEPVDQWAARLAEIRAEAAKRKGMTTEEMIAYSPKINPGMAKWDKIELPPWADGKRQVSLNVMDGLRLDPPQWLEIVPMITCPTLLLAADPAQNPATTAQAAQRAAAMNANIRVVTVIGTGHNIRREAFATYIAEVTDFLASVYSHP